MTLSQRYWMIHFINLVDNGEVFKTAIEKIPKFRGMKQSSREVAYLVRSIMNSQDGKYQVITGNEVGNCNFRFKCI